MSNTPVVPSIEKSRISRPLWPITVGAAGLAAVLPEAASACAVCFGDPDSAMTAGVNNGILVLLACVGVVQIGFVALFWSFRSRAKRLERQREQFSIIDGGVK